MWQGILLIIQVESEMSGEAYSYLGKDNYEDAIKEIDRWENSGKSAVECLSQSGC